MLVSLFLQLMTDDVVVVLLSTHSKPAALFLITHPYHYAKMLAKKCACLLVTLLQNKH